MLKGKKSLFKRDPAPITTCAAPIVIEKFDLLQAWPIYSQRQSRQSVSQGVTLIVNFHQTAFGPGDVVPVEAILRADTPGMNVQLRAYELTVRETLIYRASPPQAPQHHHPHLLHSQQPPRRVSAAQTRSNIISDQKVPVAVQVFPGSQHKCDLGCQIPLSQTNVSVRTARHIEVNYIVQVKAVLASSAIVAVELPITITNWQRQASQDVVHRIGFSTELVGGNPPPPMPAQPVGPNQLGSGPNVNLFQATNPPLVASPGPNGANLPGPGPGPGPYSNGPRPSTAGSNVIPERISRRPTVDSHERPTVASRPATSSGRVEDIDELGYMPAHAQQPHSMPGRTPASQYGSSQSGSNAGGPGGSVGAPSEPGDQFGAPGPLNQATPRPPSSHRRPNAPQRFTIVNADEPEGSKPISAEEEKRALREKYANEDRRRTESAASRVASGAGAGGSTSPAKARPQNGSAWPSAEEEKQRLYDNARQTAFKTQQGAGYNVDLGQSGSSSAGPAVGGSSANPNGSASSPARTQAWPSAEEEKRRLYESARTAAERTQQAAFEGSVPYARDDTPVNGNESSGFASAAGFMKGGPMAGGFDEEVPYSSPLAVAPVPYAQVGI